MNIRDQRRDITIDSTGSKRILRIFMSNFMPLYSKLRWDLNAYSFFPSKFLFKFYFLRYSVILVSGVEFSDTSLAYNTQYTLIQVTCICLVSWVGEYSCKFNYFSLWKRRPFRVGKQDDNIHREDPLWWITKF